MSTYRNTDDRFGDSCPIEAESKESIADEMQSLFEIWANEKEAWSREQAEELGCESCFDRAAYLYNLREEFIDALEEVV